jgi:adenylyltransferase/sulfurtransferase
MSVIKIFGKDAEKLKQKKVVIIGIGGLGCTVSNLLARMKVNLILIDDDIVDDTNLERQTLFEIKDLLKPKSLVAKEKLEQFTKINSVNERLTYENIGKIIMKDIDLVIDCTDNIETRLLINKYCHDNNIPWIYTGAVGNIGIIYFIDKDRPCYECINKNKQGDTSCEIGVLNTIVTSVASIATHCAIEFLVNKKIENDIIRISGYEITKIKTKRDPKCKICGK